uniref:uncharacterized protein LOC120345758 isoform X1 n=1 Tax=Styela clava TaxID=7725 RepID=UPI001939396F|nr:uncharacterized protein LOC120345758 isoform X1 [Styela clava]
MKYLRILLLILFCGCSLPQGLDSEMTTNGSEYNKNGDADSLKKRTEELGQANEKEKLGLPVTTERTIQATSLIPTMATPNAVIHSMIAVPATMDRPIPTMSPMSPSGLRGNSDTTNTEGKMNSTTHVPDILEVGTTPAANQISPSSGNTSKSNASKSEDKWIEGLCSYPIYNNRDACIGYLDYYTQHLSLCEYRGGVVVFAIFVASLGLTIILLNCLLPVVVWQRSDMRTQYDYIKVSLAFADMIPGFLLLTAVIPNMVWVRQHSEKQVVEMLHNDTNSPTAVIVGSLLTMSGQASLLHLMFLSIERFIAITWPFWHLLRKTRTIIVTLSLLWIASFLCAFVPAEFPQYFEYIFQPSLLIHYMTLKTIIGTSGKVEYGIHGPLYTSITMILPFTIMLVVCILTGISSYRKLKSRTKTFRAGGKFHAASGSAVVDGKQSSTGVAAEPRLKPTTSLRQKLRPEVSVFITIVTMIIGFTVTILPFGIVLILFVAKTLTCSTYTTSFVLTFYGGLANGFINPIIYSFRDERFRTAVKKLFSKRSENKPMATTTTNVSSGSCNSKL